LECDNSSAGTQNLCLSVVAGGQFYGNNQRQNDTVYVCSNFDNDWRWRNVTDLRCSDGYLTTHDDQCVSLARYNNGGGSIPGSSWTASGLGACNGTITPNGGDCTDAGNRTYPGQSPPIGAPGICCGLGFGQPENPPANSACAQNSTTTGSYDPNCTTSASCSGYGSAVYTSKPDGISCGSAIATCPAGMTLVSPCTPVCHSGQCQSCTPTCTISSTGSSPGDLVVSAPFGTRSNLTNITTTLYYNGQLTCLPLPNVSYSYNDSLTGKYVTRFAAVQAGTSCANGQTNYTLLTPTSGNYLVVASASRGSNNWVRRISIDRYSDDRYSRATPDFSVALIPLVGLAAIFLARRRK
jgi:hypothetical protein